MVNELATHTLRAGAPAPSVETILHAILPHKYVDHTHADAVLSISNAPDGEKRIRDLYGDKAVVIPYIMAGFDLAAYCAREYPKQAGRRTVGMMLLSHGVFTFAARGARILLFDIELCLEAKLSRGAEGWSVGRSGAGAMFNARKRRSFARGLQERHPLSPVHVH